MRPERVVRGNPADLDHALDHLGIRDGEVFFVSAPSGVPVARGTDPLTSHEAAEAIGNLRQSQADVFLLFDADPEPMTDERLLERYKAHMEAHLFKAQSPSGIRSRRRELVDLGLVVDTGEKTRNRNGNRAILWARAHVQEPEPEGQLALT